MCVIHIHWHVYINIICIWHIIYIYILYIYTYIYIPLYTHISYIYIYHIHRTHRDTLICWLLVKYQLPENLGWFWWLDQLHVLTELKVRNILGIYWGYTAMVDLPTMGVWLWTQSQWNNCSLAASALCVWWSAKGLWMFSAGLQLASCR